MSLRRHLMLCVATLGSWAALAPVASAGSVSLRVQREGERTRVTVSGAYTQFPSRLLVWVHSGTSACPPTNKSERLRVEAQGLPARSLLTLTLGTSGATAGPFAPDPAFTLIKPPAQACAYLLPPRGVTRDPDDPPEATAAAPIRGSARPQECRLNPSPRREMLLNRLPRRNGSDPQFLAGEFVRAQLVPPPRGCSVAWTVSGADQVPPTVVRDYNKPISETPAPVPARSDPHVLDTPVQPEPLGNDLSGDSLAFYLTAAPNRDPRRRLVTVTARIRKTRGRGRAVVVERSLAVQVPRLRVGESRTVMCPLGVNTVPIETLIPPNYILGLNPSCPNRPGISWVIRVRPPPGGEGVISLNQLITGKGVTQRDARGTVLCTTHYLATPDNPVADPSAEGVYPPVSRGRWTIRAQDSPSIALGPVPRDVGTGLGPEFPGPYGRDVGMPAGSTRTYFESFVDRVMYRPPGGIWVSIGRMTWEFRGSVTQVDRDGILKPPEHEDYAASPDATTRFSRWAVPGTNAAAGALPRWNQFSSPVKALVSCPAPPG